MAKSLISGASLLALICCFLLLFAPSEMQMADAQRLCRSRMGGCRGCSGRCPRPRWRFGRCEQGFCYCYRSCS